MLYEVSRSIWNLILIFYKKELKLFEDFEIVPMEKTRLPWRNVCLSDWPYRFLQDRCIYRWPHISVISWYSNFHKSYAKMTLFGQRILIKSNVPTVSKFPTTLLYVEPKFQRIKRPNFSRFDYAGKIMNSVWLNNEISLFLYINFHSYSSKEPLNGQAVYPNGVKPYQIETRFGYDQAEKYGEVKKPMCGCFWTLPENPCLHRIKSLRAALSNYPLALSYIIFIEEILNGSFIILGRVSQHCAMQSI